MRPWRSRTDSRRRGPPQTAQTLLDVASLGFYDGLAAGCLVAAVVAALGAVAAWFLLPARTVDGAGTTLVPAPRLRTDAGPDAVPLRVGDPR